MSNETNEVEVVEEVDIDTVEEPVNNTEEKTFTQSELDKIIADRLSREQKKREQAVEQERADADKRKLEEQNEYKELYEKAQADIETAKADALNVKKDALLKDAGYNAEQVQAARKLIEGDSEEEITKSIEQIKGLFPTQSKGADPSPFNGRKDEVKTTDKEEIGRNAVSRVLHKIRL